MLHHFTFILFKLKLVQPSEDTFRFWVSTKAVTKIEYALIHGNYKTRQLAAEALKYSGRPSSIPILLNATNDKIHKVSIAALNTLETLECDDELVLNIIKKRFNWLKEIGNKDLKRQVKKDKKHNIYRWKRASKESFDRVKEQLKKPIR
jgi:hypothetical protein